MIEYILGILVIGLIVFSLYTVLLKSTSCSNAVESKLCVDGKNHKFIPVVAEGYNKCLKFCTKCGCD